MGCLLVHSTAAVAVIRVCFGNLGTRVALAWKTTGPFRTYRVFCSEYQEEQLRHTKRYTTFWMILVTGIEVTKPFLLAGPVGTPCLSVYTAFSIGALKQVATIKLRLLPIISACAPLAPMLTRPAS